MKHPATALALLPAPGNGLGLLFMEDALAMSKQAVSAVETNAETALPVITPLHRRLTSLYLANPFWNDFRLLNYFEKQGIPLTHSKLKQLKQECSLEDRDSVCATLIHLTTEGGLELTENQLRFIERTKPEFRDRDIRPQKPGEVLLYKRLFGRGLGSFGRLYFHTFVDMYTKQAISHLSPYRTIAAGKKVFETHILPAYRAQNYPVLTVFHSTQDNNDLKEYQSISKQDFPAQTPDWLLTDRSFGIIEKLEHYLVQKGLFSKTPESFTALQHCIDQWLEDFPSH
ncbi:MAG: hypothetical protein E6713_08665 [Sporomusaceae bacterium]|nr:hypothetical protein [Sporomusaceae bacterium]